MNMNLQKFSRKNMKVLKDDEEFSMERVENINIPKIRHESYIDFGGSRLTGNTNTAALNAALGLLIRAQASPFRFRPESIILLRLMGSKRPTTHVPI